MIRQFLRAPSPLRQFPRARSYLRRWSPRVILFGSVASVGIAPQYSLYFISGWSAVAAFLLLLSVVTSRQVVKKFGKDILKFVNDPTPAASVLSSLRGSHIAPETIRYAWLESADAPSTVRYIRQRSSGIDGQSFLETLGPNAKIVVLAKTNLPPESRNQNQIRIIPARQRLTKHINLFVTATGRSYVWYEPYHVIINDKHWFPRGAYLIAVSETKRDEILRDYRERIADTAAFLEGDILALTAPSIVKEKATPNIEDNADWNLFQSLAKQWQEERGAVSSISQMALCYSYQRIIAMGERAIPLILRQLEQEGDEPDHWFWALRMLTGINPIPEEARGDMRAMARAWIEWGEKKWILREVGQRNPSRTLLQ